jgi:PAS domain S-box-containing protein
VYACDWDGTVVSWNQAAERLTGISASGSIGRRCWDVIRGQDAAGNRVCHDGCEVSKRVKRGRPVSCPPIVVQTKAGARWIEISTLIVREGSRPLVIHTAREVTPVASASAEVEPPHDS